MATWLAGATPQIEVDQQTYTWHGLNAGSVSVEAVDEDEARRKANGVLVLRACDAFTENYTTADLEFDLMCVRDVKPEVKESASAN
jgi:hypothetical protein